MTTKPRRRVERPSTAKHIDRSVDSTAFFERVVASDESYRSDRFVHCDDAMLVEDPHNDDVSSPDDGEFSAAYWKAQRPPHYGG